VSRLVEGEWVAEADLETDDDGEFKRQEQAFHDRLGTDAFPVEAGRYHLYISRACPWAHRVAMTRSLKGQDDAISLSLVQPERYDEGWEFSDAHPDPLYGADYLRELYVRADSDFTGRPTVPVLWDTETGTIVNNESEEIMRTLDVAGHELGTRDVDLYPEGYRDEVDRLIDDIPRRGRSTDRRHLRPHQQRRLPRRLRRLTERLRPRRRRPVRRARPLRRPAGGPAISGRRRTDRGRPRHVRYLGALRSRLPHPLQM